LIFNAAILIYFQDKYGTLRMNLNSATLFRCHWS